MTPPGEDRPDDGPPAAADTGRAAPAGRLHRPGARVEVRSTFEERRWSKGFEVVEVLDEGYRLKRLSDGSLMPVTFDDDDVRAERRSGTWWF